MRIILLMVIQLLLKSADKSSIDFTQIVRKGFWGSICKRFSVMVLRGLTFTGPCCFSDFDWFFFVFMLWKSHKDEICKISCYYLLLVVAKGTKRHSAPSSCNHVVVTAKPPFMQPGGGFLWASVPCVGVFSSQELQERICETQEHKGANDFVTTLS